MSEESLAANPELEFSRVTGCDDGHLCHIDCGRGRHALTPATAAAFRRLAESASAEGFELAIASAHRDFQRQLSIWNAKASGHRPVLNECGEPIPIARLSARELVFAILRWSALPGTSRHHWGTDLDIYDAAAVAPTYRVQLTPGETVAGGVFGGLHRWLDRQIENGQALGFYRPYAEDHGGVAPEPWHLSYGPESRRFRQLLAPQACYHFLAQQPITLGSTVLEHFEEIYQRFIMPAEPDIVAPVSARSS